MKRGKGGSTGSAEGPGWRRRKRRRDEALQRRFDRLAGPVTVRKREEPTMCDHAGSVMVDHSRLSSGEWSVRRRCPHCGWEWTSTVDELPDDD